jgi:hypothetical protein
MVSNKKLLISSLSGLVLCATASAIGPDVPQNRYQNIVERNLFGLKDLPKAESPSPPSAPPPRITLTGITTILGNKLAIMTAMVPAKPGEPAKELPLMLAEGQRDGNIEVLGIDEKSRSVRVNDFGEVTTLTFEKNGPKLATSPAQSTAPVVPTNSNLPVPSPSVPGTANPFTPGSATNSGVRSVPTRGLRLPVSDPGLVSPQTNSAPAAAGIPVLPIPPLQPTPMPAPPISTQPQGGQAQQLSAEEQMILDELERERNRNNPLSAPTQQPPLTPAATNQTYPSQVPRPLLPQ